ncbi:MAG TPA: MerR family transcriptional regulator [Stellaceae bacterium]|nr:MerR family transcriptional regulator [Stellaceae bacterium]
MSEREAAAPRRAGKSPAAFRTTGEVAEELDLPPHVLRFWESKFAQLKPLKRGGGRRYYRPEDVDLLRSIRRWLYQEGYTIRGVQKLLRGGGRDGEAAQTAPPPTVPAAATLFSLEEEATRAAPPRPNLRTALEEVRRELLELRALLDKL